MKKNMWKFMAFVLFLCMPCLVSASEAESYIHYDNIKAGEDFFNGWSSGGDDITLDMDNKANYSFDLKGYNLDVDETYVLELSSDFVDFTKEYTGEELSNGVSISRNDGNGMMNSKVYVKSSEEVLKSKITIYEGLYNKVDFKFNYNFNSTEIDAYFEEIAPNGVIELNAIKLDDAVFTETAISASLSKYNTEKFRIYGYCEEDYEKCTLSISDMVHSYRYKDFDVEYVFQDTDEEILDRVNAYLKKFERPDGVFEPTFYLLEDLENINYKYMIVKHGSEDMITINSIINYSSEIQSILDYGNFTAILDTRAGWGEEFTAGGFGFLNLLYNGVIYGAVDGVGVKQINALYVSDDTEDNRDAYINAALKRVQDYLPNAKVTLTYSGLISEIDQTDWIVGLDELIDVDKTLGEYYTLTIDGVNHSFFIVKDSSRMNNPEMNTVDLKTSIKINSDSYEVPLDSKINADVIEFNSKEYKNIINKLKLDKGMVVDLSLFSDLANSYVTKLDDGKFKVFIPLEKEYLNKKLNAYYIKDDGSVETHNVVVENGYAVFETNHFSTYTIGGELVNNPATIDNISTWIILSICAILGLLFVGIYNFKKNLI